jgi:hypothetical protein
MGSRTRAVGSVQIPPAVREHPEARTTKEGFVIERRILPSGDPFYAAASRKPAEERHHGCHRGVVYIGHMVEDLETGEEVEVFDRARCRRCQI